MNKMNKLKIAAFVSLVLAVMVVGVVFAITITVDGDKESAWSGSGGQTPGNTTDPNETEITDNRDIASVSWTNDESNFYLMLETYGTPSLASFPNQTDIYFCINTDNNTSTGSTYENCNNQTGIDRYIHVLAASGVAVYDSDFLFVGNGTLGYNTGVTNPVIEVSVLNSDLGLSSSNCTQSMPMTIFFDNGTTDPDDNTPNTGQVDIGCGSPTAITLSSLEARSPWLTSPYTLSAAVLLLIAAMGGLVLAVHHG